MQGKNQSLKGYAPLKSTEESKEKNGLTSVNVSSHQDSNTSKEVSPMSNTNPPEFKTQQQKIMIDTHGKS